MSKKKEGIITKAFGRFGYVKKGAGSSVWPAYLDDPAPGPRVPKWDHKKIYDFAEKSWVMQEIVGVYRREVKRPGWSLPPSFISKCVGCGAEFQSQEETCPHCEGKEFVKPNVDHLRLAKKILGTPNRNRESWGDILGSIIEHDLLADEWFMSVGWQPLLTEAGEPASWRAAEVYVEDSRYIQKVMDKRGRFGGTPHICPFCYPDKSKEKSKTEKPCPVCGTRMELTYYVQKVNDRIENRFTRDQMVSGSTYKRLPNPDPSPRIVGVWEALHTVQAIDHWFYDTYITGRLGKIVNFPEYQQEELNELDLAVKAHLRKLDQIDVTSGQARAKKTARLLMLASPAPIAVHNLIEDPTAMKAMEYYLTLIAAITGVFGIQLLYVNLEQQGRVGTAPAIKMEVQNHVLEEIQRDKEEVINGQLFPLFGITDYKFKFNPLEKRDEFNDAQILQSKSNALINFARIPGLKVRVDDDGEVSFSGEFEGGVLEAGLRPDGTAHPQGKESETTHNQVEGTTVQRDPKKPRGT